MGAYASHRTRTSLRAEGDGPDGALARPRHNNPDALQNFRTPRFDLDCVYGRGPDDQPYLYEKDDSAKLLAKPLRRSGYATAAARRAPLVDFE